MHRVLGLVAVLGLGVLFAACGSDDSDRPFTSGGGAAGSGGTGGVGGATGGMAGAGEDGGPTDSSVDVSPDSPVEDGSPDVQLPDTGPASCPVTFEYKPGGSPNQVLVAGEWQGFETATAPVMTSGAGGVYSVTVDLEPGLHAYKFVVDGDWRLDPNQGRRKYIGSPAIENSAIKVADCRLPTLSVASSAVARPSTGAGTYTAKLSFQDGIEGSGADVASYGVELKRNGEVMSLAGGVDVQASGDVNVSLSGLQDGKYRLMLTPRSKNGRSGEPLRLIFWVEEEAFSWKDALVYMILTDRYRDGDASNNASPTQEADPRGDWQGGDLQGVRASIADGTLDALGVRAIWLTPFQTNPVGAYLAGDGIHRVTGYHGYWPIKARQVDPRLGGEQALRDLIDEAHAHGIRILQDYVLNHVHEEHEYVAAHPEWFRTGCVCGTANCGWTSHALECMFSQYMPDINHTVPEANAAFVDDAIWWMDEFDIDGLRVDAVKHVEEAATRNLAMEVRETFEATGVRHFLMGETAMGWNDCPDPCNDENYGTISRYIGPHGLDGQFDFVLYHGVSYNTFATDSKGMLHADYWFQHGMENYPSDAVMTPYIGSHDTARFVTLADPDNAWKAHHQWDDTAGAPKSDLPYERIRVGLAWLLNLPGAPLLYYGDEYGQWGGADPNNRLMWRQKSSLNQREGQTLEFVQKLGMARKTIPALRRGDYVSLHVTEDILVFGRKASGMPSAVVALTRSSAPEKVTVNVDGTLGLKEGTVLTDHIGGGKVTVSGSGSISFTIPEKSAVVLAP